MSCHWSCLGRTPITKRSCPTHHSLTQVREPTSSPPPSNLSGVANTNEDLRPEDPTNPPQDIMVETEVSPLPSLPREAIALEASLRHSVTEWKSDIRSLVCSMSKAGARGAGAPKSPGRPDGSEAPSRAAGKAFRPEGTQSGLKQDLAVPGQGCRKKKSPADSEASSGATTPEVLSDKIFRLRWSGEEYTAAFEQYTNKLCELGLECEDTPAHREQSWARPCSPEGRRRRRH